MAVLAGRRTRQLEDAAEHFGVRWLAAAFTP